jgi:hypothetical protein
MKTIRRLYFYLVSFISLEVVLWGLINLLRTMFNSGLTFPGADTLAQALALIFVGVPIFAVHWLWTQRAARSDPEEQSASLRAIFLYGVLLATLIPVLQNILSFVDRTLVVSAGYNSYRALVGGSQTWIDNLIAILFNLIAAAYFYNTLRNSWATLKEQENFADIRRLYHYIWVLYSLLMMIFGVQQVMSFLFYQPTAIISEEGRDLFINGLALIMVGSPVWYFSWNICQQTRDEPGERGSVLRLGVLYLLALAGVLVVLISGGLVSNLILRRILGEVIPWSEFISQIGAPISVGLPLAVIWAYYGHWLRLDIAATSGETRRSALKRFYYYILALIGVIATFIGLSLLLSFLVTILTGNGIWGDSQRSSLCGALATLISGLPLWLAAWMPMQAEARLNNDAGDHARRSLMRRAYLYIAIFSTVIGGMASAIFLVYTILFGFLDHRSDNFLTEVLNGLQLLGLFSAFLIYHWNTLRQDGSHTADALAAKQARFAVLVFETQGSGFGDPIQEAIRRASSAIPVAVQVIEEGIPESTIPVQAVVLPSSLALNQPEALRLWLKNYEGGKIIVPTPEPGWYWPGIDTKNPAQVAAQIVRLLSEGQEVRTSGASANLQIVAYVFAVLFGLQLLIGLLSFGIQLIVR